MRWFDTWIFERAFAGGENKMSEIPNWFREEALNWEAFNVSTLRLPKRTEDEFEQWLEKRWKEVSQK